MFIEKNDNTNCDAWGNIKLQPETIAERHGDNFVSIAIYKIDSNYYFGYQIKLVSVLVNKAGNISGKKYQSADAARLAACLEMRNIIQKNRAARKAVSDFKIVVPEQLELF